MTVLARRVAWAAGGVAVAAAVAAGSVAVSAGGHEAAAAVLAPAGPSCALPSSVDGDTWQLSCTVPRATATVTETVAPTQTPSSTPPSPAPSGSATATPGSPPDAGVDGRALTAQAGGTVTQAGTVIDGRDITGRVTIAAPGVVIRNSRIHGTDGYGVYVQSGSVVLDHVTISGFTSAGIAGSNWTGRYVELTGLRADGVKLGSNVVLDHSWCHAMTPASGAHADCAQLESGQHDVTIRDSWLDPQGCCGNSAIILKNDLGPASSGPVTVAGNVLGGGNYTLYAVTGSGGLNQGGITIGGNRFLRDYKYGPVDVTIPATAPGNSLCSTDLTGCTPLNI